MDASQSFTITTPRITFGPGVLGILGDIARRLGMRRPLLVTDRHLAALPAVATARAALEEAGLVVTLFDAVEIEPTDRSFHEAIRFATDGGFDGFVSVGGGSVMDTAKVANLYSSWPDDFLAYVNAPIGEGRNVPGPLKPHIACPTTCGTGSECTGIAVFDLLSMKAKTGIMSHHMVPRHAVVDPEVTASLPRTALACTALDTICHALEAWTCRPVHERALPREPDLRPMTQGANPWSDLVALEPIRLVAANLEAALADPPDMAARGRLLWAATLAGNSFGNAGCHVPHALSYPVSGMVRNYRPEDYPPGPPLVPHGMAVILNAPPVYRLMGERAGPRLLEAARALGADTEGVDPREGGALVADRLVHLMRMAGLPNGLEAIGFSAIDIAALTEGALPQKRLLDNAPVEITADVVDGLYRAAMRYW